MDKFTWRPDDLMLLVTGALSVVGARIYRRSILRIGRVVTWKEAIGR